EIGLALEGAAQIVDAVGVTVQELDDGEDEVIGLVEGGEDLVLGDGDGGGTDDAALDLEEAQGAGAGDAALDVVAELVGLAVAGLKAEVAFGPHDDGAGASSGGLGVEGGRGGGEGAAVDEGEQAGRDRQ